MPRTPPITDLYLSNGARIRFEVRPQVASAAVALLLRGGTRDEADHAVGQLHLLEHMLLRRTRMLSAQTLAQRIARLGGEVNAETGREHFGLLGRAPAAQAPELAALLASCLCQPTFDAADLALERRVIAAERTFMGQASVLDALIRLAWPAHPLGRPLQAVDTPTADPAALRALWSRHCVGARLHVAVTGNFDPAAVQAALAQLAALPPGQPPRHSPPRFAPGRYGVLREDRPTELLWALPCSPFDPEHTVGWQLSALVLETALGNQLRHGGLVYAWSVEPLLYTDAGLIAVRVQAPAGMVRRSQNAVERCLQTLATNKPDKAAVETAKRCWLARRRLARDEPYANVRTLALAPAADALPSKGLANPAPHRLPGSVNRLHLIL